METSFDNTTHRLEFKQEILDDPIIIEIYRGGPNPYYTIDPLNTPDDIREYYFYQGLEYIFDIIPIWI